MVILISNYHNRQISTEFLKHTSNYFNLDISEEVKFKRLLAK